MLADGGLHEISTLTVRTVCTVKLEQQRRFIGMSSSTLTKTNDIDKSQPSSASSSYVDYGASHRLEILSEIDWELNGDHLSKAGFGPSQINVQTYTGMVKSE
jgi:hypothetical protein